MIIIINIHKEAGLVDWEQNIFIDKQNYFILDKHVAI